jgi:hypothetical protein
MLTEAPKYRLLLMAGALPSLLVTVYLAISGWNRQGGEFASLSSADTATAASPVETMKTALAKDRELLAGYEREQSALRAEVIKRRKLFAENQAAKEQVVEAEKNFVAALRRVHDMRHSVDETDIAITEAVLGEKVLRMPLLGENGFRETAELAHFNGRFKWSLKEAPRLEKYFSQTFGRPLPVTARGQTTTHNRLGFDHRDAMDVAIHPDSREGKALMDHLRKSGIPFTAFRGVVAGASTGAHIHIGKPSGRLTRWN